MLKIGLTGGIGSGKTTVAQLFANLGVPIIDADIIAREVIANDPAVLQKIVKHFGGQVLETSGSLNRNYLRKIIFEQPEQRRWLEALLHPLIIAQMKLQARAIKAPYCLLVIPLLIESTLPYALVDRILVVDAAEEMQLQRTQQRDNLSVEEVQHILHSQATRTQRLQMADDVIENNGDREMLKAAVQKMHQYYLGPVVTAPP